MQMGILIYLRFAHAKPTNSSTPVRNRAICKSKGKKLSCPKVSGFIILNYLAVFQGFG